MIQCAFCSRGYDYLPLFDDLCFCCQIAKAETFLNKREPGEDDQ